MSDVGNLCGVLVPSLAFVHLSLVVWSFLSVVVQVFPVCLSCHLGSGF